MIVLPISLEEANAFVVAHHRHHGAVVGHKFSIGVAVNGRVVGVAIVGRPVSRGLDNGLTLELTRLCTDGTRNAGSFLLGKVRRASAALGYQRLVTYTLQGEGGASLRAAGWKQTELVRGRSWSTPSRPRVDTHPLQHKLRWEAS